MGRPIRHLKKTFVIFCEGDTEYNYFTGMKNLPNLEITLKPVNMHGGGYKSFLQAIKKESSLNRIATFIIVDGDRANNIKGELKALQELQEYCVRQNDKDCKKPYFLIVDSPNFEYIACLHDSNYSGGDTIQHIKNVFKFENIDSFKGNPNIYSFLNTNSKNHKHMIGQINKRPKLISNRYIRDGMLISISGTDKNWDLIGQRSSNIEEFFDIALNN